MNGDIFDIKRCLKTANKSVTRLLKAGSSKYPNHTTELVSHLNIDNSKIFDTQTSTGYDGKAFEKDVCHKSSMHSSS